jgi:hypothetical protein
VRHGGFWPGFGKKPGISCRLSCHGVLTRGEGIRCISCLFMWLSSIEIIQLGRGRRLFACAVKGSMGGSADC